MIIFQEYFLTSPPCLFKLKYFNCSYSFVTFPFIKLEIRKPCIPQNNLFGQYEHTNEFIESFWLCVSLIALYSSDTHSFLILIPNFMFFLHNPLEMINICVTITTYNYHTIFFLMNPFLSFQTGVVFFQEKN